MPKIEGFDYQKFSDELYAQIIAGLKEAYSPENLAKGLPRYIPPRQQDANG